MRRTLAILLTALAVSSLPNRTLAQAPPPAAPSPCQVVVIADVPRCASVGERLRVLTTEWQHVEGEFLGYAEERMVLRSGRDRIVSFNDADLVEIAVIRPERNADRIGQSIGAALGVALILVSSGVAQTDAEAIGMVVGLGAVGGAVGLLVPEDIPRAVLRRQPSDPIPAAAAAVPNAPRFASSVQRLPVLLEREERIRLRRADTSTLEGRYAGLEGETLLVRSEDRLHRIDSRDLLSVERLNTRHPSARKWAVLTGAALLTLAWIGSTLEEPGEPPLTRGEIAGAVIGGGVIGAGAGAAISRLVTVTDRELIFYRPSATVSINVVHGPMIGWRVGF
jgi:hypothetical protein